MEEAEKILLNNNDNNNYNYNNNNYNNTYNDNNQYNNKSYNKEGEVDITSTQDEIKKIIKKAMIQTKLEDKEDHHKSIIIYENISTAVASI